MNFTLYKNELKVDHMPEAKSWHDKLSLKKKKKDKFYGFRVDKIS